MSTPMLHFNAVPDEATWTETLTTWRSDLLAFWRLRGRTEAVWTWSERTNVGLLASAFERSGANRRALAEVSIRGTSKGHADRIGRVDLRMTAPGWECHVEAKEEWIGSWRGGSHERVNAVLAKASVECQRLRNAAWVERVVLVTFIVPNVAGTGRRADPAGVVDGFASYAEGLWKALGSEKGAFQDTFVLPADELVPLQELHTGRQRYFPGIIVHGRVIKAALKRPA